MINEEDTPVYTIMEPGVQTVSVITMAIIDFASLPSEQSAHHL